jgi:hypothetical protein
MQTANIIKTIKLKLSPTTTGIIPLFDNSLNQFNDSISKAAFVKTLKAFSKITSLTPVRLPNFRLEDSESEKLYKTLDVEFNSPRKQLDLFIGNVGSWEQVGSVSLLNPSGYPYRMFNLLDFYSDGIAAELGDGMTLGVQVVDVGFGLLQDTDFVTIHGNINQEYLLPGDSNNNNGGNNGSGNIDINVRANNINSCSSKISATTGNDFTQLLAKNDSRLYFLIENNDRDSITLKISDAFITIKPGGTFDLSAYNGEVLFKSDSGNLVTSIKVMECFC